MCEVSFRENRAEFQAESDVLRMSGDGMDTLSPSKGTPARNLFKQTVDSPLGQTGDNPPTFDVTIIEGLGGAISADDEDLRKP